jgi:PAS domain S-box-containing protein
MEARLIALARATEKIFAAPSLPAALRIAAGEARSIFDADRSGITLDRGSGSLLRVTAPEAGDGAASGPGGPGPGPGLTAPLIGRDGAAIGRIDIAGARRGAFDRRDAAALDQFARLASVAIENLRLVEAARHAEIRFKEIAACGSEVLWETDAQHRYTWLSVRPGHVTALPVERCYGMTRWEMFGIDTRAPLWAAHLADLAARRPFADFEYTFAMADGSIHHRRANGRPVFDDDGVFRGYRGATADTTDLRRAEAAARANQERFRDFAEIASDWLWESDERHRIVAISGNLAAVDEDPVGRTRWELRGQNADDPAWRRHIADLDAHRPFRDFLFTLHDASGRAHHLVVNGRPRFSEDGRFLGYRGTTTDRTAQREAEAAAAASERKFRQIVETAHEGIWTLGPDGRTRYVNPRLCEMLGYDEAQIMGRPHWEFLLPEQQAAARSVEARGVARGVEQREYCYRRRDGSSIWVLVTSNPISENGGGGQGIIGMLVDITERKQAEDRAARAKREVDALLASISDGFVAIDDEGRFTDLNAAAERILRRPAADLLGRTAFEAIGIGADNVFALCYAEARKEREPIAFAAWSDAFGLWLEVRANPHAAGLTLFFRDVTAERQAHLALIDSERKLREALDEKQSVLASISDAFVTLDNEWRFTFINAAAERLWNVDARTLIGRDSYGLHGNPANPFYGNFVESKRTGEPIAFSAYSDLFGKWLEVRGYPHPAGYTVFCRDASEERRIHRELIVSRQSLDAAREINERLFETSLDLICITDSYGNFVSVNPGTAQQFGYPIATMIGRNASAYIHPDDIEATRAELRLVRTTQRPRKFGNRCRRADGSYVPVNWSTVWSAAERKYFLIGHDMTEQIAAQEQLGRAQRLQAIGQLTGGIAHDFNNLLTVIMGNSDILSDALKNQPSLRRHAELNLAAASRAAGLTAQLLAFARRQTLAPGPVDPNGLVRGMRELLERALGAQVEIALELDPSTWRCKVDATQLETALLNLALNARDAMGAGGLLRIATVNRVVAAGASSDLAPGDYAVIEVSDTGIGMSSEILARVFEPFFTTKDIGKGSGLGLAMVYGFVKQSGGHVEVESARGRGTTFRLFLPRLDEAAAEQPPPAAAWHQEPLPGGTERILVVEDDAAVREMVVTRLSGLGYRVDAAGNGAGAAAILAGAARFDLLFSDVLMPGGVNGIQLAANALARRPGLKVLLTTGHAALPGSAAVPEPACVHWLRKPYKIADLAVAIRRALDHDQGNGRVPAGGDADPAPDGERQRAGTERR